MRNHQQTRNLRGQSGGAVLWLLLLLAIGGMAWAYLDYTKRFPDKEISPLRLIQEGNFFGGGQQDHKLVETVDLKKLAEGRREFDSVLADLRELENKVLADADTDYGPADAMRDLKRISQAVRKAQAGTSGETAQELGAIAEFYEALRVLWEPYHTGYRELESIGFFNPSTFRSPKALRNMRDSLAQMKEANLKLSEFYLRLPVLLRRELMSRPISQERREEVYQTFMRSYHATSTRRQRLYDIDDQLFTKTISRINFLRVRTEEKRLHLSCVTLHARGEAQNLAMENFGKDVDRLLEERKALVKELIRIDRALDKEAPRSREFVSL